ncbi:DUF2271 domain-containing protein [Shewanella psychropiezotolerans]|uniref:DUF2271 domain-containing protein n=1 Tax=Shewanella psychropiezotolerans TaxID=2593655 RepID=A0ABX5X5M0_9GAMM|nr:DUF2271 domain-containing protein [Shewanella sp. YLB-07]QDO86655.1 DUF2271 domain-containing protein [Shewanella psychropiezotolerans]
MKRYLARSLLFFSLIIVPSWACAEVDAGLDIEVNLPEITQGQYLRPYTAVWIENAKGKHISTLALWRWDEGYKWLKDIRRWWRKAGREDSQLVDGMSSATRPAGKYQLHWDMTDVDGHAVPNGKYTLLMEVVREHGGRDLVRHKFELGSEAFTAKIAPTEETGEIKIHFQP